MLAHCRGRIFRSKGAILLVILSLAGPAMGQEVSVALLRPESISSAPAPFVSTTSRTVTLPERPVHRFWDRENDWLFAGVGAGRALDYASTLNLRHRGIDEAFLTNSIVDNHPLFAGIEVAATAASVGVSYIFHRTGHHRLERWTSAIHA